MARAEANWERLVRAALRGERLGSAYGQPVTGIAGNVPSSLGNNVHIEEVLRAADEIQDEDPTIARIRKHFCAAELGKRPRRLWSLGFELRRYGLGYRSFSLQTSSPSLVLVAVRLLRYAGSLVFGITLDNYASLQTWALVLKLADSSTKPTLSMGDCGVLFFFVLSINVWHGVWLASMSLLK
jgi:hypothetical protein